MSPAQRYALLATAAAALVALIWLLAPILTPFVLGAGLAYLGDPLVDRLQKLGLSRTGGVAVVFVVIFSVILLIAILLLPMLYEQVITFLHRIPEWLRWIQDEGLPKLGLSLPEGTRLDAEGLKQVITEHWSKAGGVAAALWARASASGAALLLAVTNLMLVPVVTFYLLRDWDDLVARIRDLIPRRALPKITQLARESDEVLAGFIRGQLLVMAGLALIYTIGLWIVGVDLALLIGLGAGVVSFVPYLGFIVGILAASVAVIVQTQQLLPLVWIAIVFGIGQLMESMLLTPWLVGQKIGLHPVAVIFAILAGGQLFGFIGVLLALPASAVLAVLVRHVLQRWLQSDAYGQETTAVPTEIASPPANPQ